jgi:hypothetical protein
VWFSGRPGLASEIEDDSAYGAEEREAVSHGDRGRSDGGRSMENRQTWRRAGGSSGLWLVSANYGVAVPAVTYHLIARIDQQATPVSRNMVAVVRGAAQEAKAYCRAVLPSSAHTRRGGRCQC